MKCHLHKLKLHEYSKYRFNLQHLYVSRPLWSSSGEHTLYRKHYRIGCCCLTLLVWMHLQGGLTCAWRVHRYSATSRSERYGISKEILFIKCRSWIILWEICGSVFIVSAVPTWLYTFRQPFQTAEPITCFTHASDSLNTYKGIVLQP